MKKVIVRTVIVLVILLLLSAGAFAALQFFRPGKKLPGTWTMNVDLTDEVVKTADDWLGNAILGNKVSLRDHTDGLLLPVYFEIAEDGTCSTYIRQEDYDALADESYTAFADAMNELLTMRLKDAGVEADAAKLDEYVKNAVGSDTAEYLKANAPSIMPEYENVFMIYSKEGTYMIEKETITIDGTVYDYLVNDTTLMLHDVTTGENKVYARVNE